MSREAQPPDFLAWLRTARTEEGPFPEWPYIDDLAATLTSGQDVTVLKRRQILASWLLAAYAHWTAAYHPNAHVAIVSAGQREADELSRKIGYLAATDASVTAQDGRSGAKQGIRLRRYASGSQIVVLPSTPHAGIGYTLRLAIFDEFSAHPHDRANLAAIRPAVANGQLVICSTTHPGIGAAGAFYEAWEAATSGAMSGSGPRAVFLGRDVRPDQGEDWIEAEQARHGYTVEEMAAYYPRTPEEAFSAPSGLVYRFDPNRNVAHGQASCARMGTNGVIPECGHLRVPGRDNYLYRIVGIDIGANDPTAVVALGVLPRDPGPAHDLRADFDLGRFHVYAMRWGRGAEYADSRGIGKWIKEQLGPVDAIFVDGADPSLAPTLQGMSLPAFTAPKNRGVGIGRVASLIDSGALTIDPRSGQLIREFATYWWDDKRDTDRSIDPFATRTPRQEHHADALDALRYAVMGYLFAMPPTTAPRIQRFGAKETTTTLHRFGGRGGG